MSPLSQPALITTPGPSGQISSRTTPLDPVPGGRPTEVTHRATYGATYGALMAATRDAVEHALALGAQRLPDAATGAAEIAGYTRFLRYAGNHLHTLIRLADLPNNNLSRLVNRLNAITETEPTGGRWLHAATLLGTAHDILGTHLTGVGIPRTPEAEDLVGPPTLAACADLAELILTAAQGSRQLLYRTARAQQRLATKPVTTQRFYLLYKSNDAASLYARAALWDLNHLTKSHAPSRLLHLRPALQLDQITQITRPEFATSLAALRLLRHYSHTQARDLTPASPASLRDLAVLAARVTDPEPTLAHLPAPATSLDRVRRAHLVDQLNDAHQAWANAASDLTRTVQGLTKAPAGYGAAVHQLLHDELTPELRRAIGTALPRMGIEAAVTIQRLAATSDLVTLQRPPLKTRHEWRPITPEHAEALAEQFTTAARASRRAFAAIATKTTTEPAASQPHETAHRRRGVALEQSRQVSR